MKTRAVQFALFSFGLLLCSISAHAQLGTPTAANNEATTATAVTVTKTVTAGDFLLACSKEGLNTTSTLTVTETGGSDTWTQIGGYASLSGRVGCFYVCSAGSGTTAVVLTWSGALSGTIDGVVLEESGVATSSCIDPNAANPATAKTTSSSVSTLTSNTLSTTNANAILLNATGTGGTSGGFTAGTGYTIPTNGASAQLAIEYKIVSATQSGVTSVMNWTTLRSNDLDNFGAFDAPTGGGSTPGFDKRRKLDKLVDEAVLQ